MLLGEFYEQRRSRFEPGGKKFGDLDCQLGVLNKVLSRVDDGPHRCPILGAYSGAVWRAQQDRHFSYQGTRLRNRGEGNAAAFNR